MLKRRTKRVAIVGAGVVLIAVLVILLVTTLSAPKQEKTENPWDSVPKNTYDNSLFRTDSDGIKHYSAAGSTVGVDVSVFNDNILWDEVAEKVDWCMIRLGYRGYESGALNLDDSYNENVASAEQYDIPFGVYFFSEATNADEARAEAEFVIKNLKGHRVTMPVVYDMEITHDEARSAGLNMTQRTECTVAFCERIREAGYTPCVYGNQSWFYSYINTPKIVEYGYKIWLAEYNPTPTYKYHFDYWQYSDGVNFTSDPDEYYDMNIGF